MKVLTSILILLAALIDPTKLGKINTLKAEAKKAYTSGDYKAAIAAYRYLIDSLQVQEDEVSINLANAYFQLNDTTNALSHYQSLTQSSKNHIRSNAQQQLGVMANRAGKFEEALNHFKKAIKSDATNEDARYNYELLKKKLEEKKKQEEQKQNQDKQNQDKDQENKEKKDQQEKNEDQKKEQDQKKEDQKDQQQKDQQQKEQQEKEKQQQQSEKEKEQEKRDPLRNPEQMKMSEEKAKMILEAMKAQEKQYLQQNKRKATKPKDKGKPDW